MGRLDEHEYEVDIKQKLKMIRQEAYQEGYKAGQRDREKQIYSAIQKLVETDYQFIECELLAGDLIEAVKESGNEN